MHSSQFVTVICTLCVAFAGRGVTRAADSTDAIDIQVELGRSKSDYIVYVPRGLDGSTFDSGNEHFLVFLF